MVILEPVSIQPTGQKSFARQNLSLPFEWVKCQQQMLQNQLLSTSLFFTLD